MDQDRWSAGTGGGGGHPAQSMDGTRPPNFFDRCTQACKKRAPQTLESFLRGFIASTTFSTKSPRRKVVRSSAGAGVIYPPFLGVIRVAYPKA